MQMSMETNNVVLIGMVKDIYLSYQPKLKEKLKEVTIYPYEKAINDTRFTTTPAVGQIFIKVPDIDKYVLNDDSLELNIQRAHINVFFEFCRMLGAVKCEYTLSINKHSHSFLSNIFNAKTPKGIGNVSVEREEEKELRQQLNVKYNNFRVDDSYVLTSDEWERANKFLNNSDYLKRDDSCVSLLNARNPSERTQVGSMEVTLTISQDINTDTKVAAELSTIGDVVKVNNNTAVKRKFNKTVSAHFMVVFKEG